MNRLLTSQTTETYLLGGKGAALAELGKGGFSVPPWFAVPTDAVIPPEELNAAVQALGGDRFAVRSSAAAEDGSAYSFAGQFSTYLEVPPSEVQERIGDVRASVWSESVRTYCREHGLDEPLPPTVLVQCMIAARFAGVAFSADPVSGHRAIAVVSAVEGTGESLVSGESDGENWRVDCQGKVVEKPASPLLEKSQAEAIAALARACERHFGRPQDIEWAIDGTGVLWLLQSRPITTLGSLPDPDDPLRVWDNSNIAESYGGVTTPLTFSFARRAYEAVYREFCRLLSVPEDRIEAASDVFPQMLGSVRGRVYYNLLSWYRVLALLPGFSLNRSFMEQMMGVREPLPKEMVERIIEENKRGKAADAFALAKTCVGLVRSLCKLPRDIKFFQDRLDHALSPSPVPMEQMSGEQLVAEYRRLESQLLLRWDAPLVNDFFAMIFYGVLRSLCSKWAGDRDGTLQNELLLADGDIISAEPPRRIKRMAAHAARVEGLPSLLANPEVPEARKLATIREHPELARELDAYLHDFGDRCLEELKLESPTVRDDATTLLSSIGALALRPAEKESPPVPAPVIPALGSTMRRTIFGYVLKQARTRVRNRENLRFERTRVFGRVRTIVRELGRRLHADGQLDASDDVFYLELGEVLAAFDGTGTVAHLGSLATLRRTEYDGFRSEPAPPDRFMTRGPIHRHAVFESNRAATDTGENTQDFQGVGACPGLVRGRVRVVHDPRGARLEPGEILVAQQTDPGWVVLFPAASGLLVERGSLLSHSAIVSRELRLPCIVSLPGITSQLKTGELIEMDGRSGRITRLDDEK